MLSQMWISYMLRKEIEKVEREKKQKKWKLNAKFDIVPNLKTLQYLL